MLLMPHQLVPFLAILLGRVSSALNRKSSAVIVMDKMNKSILFLKRSPTDKWMPGKWALPGGRLNNGEEFRDAAVRETKEETNLDILPSDLIPVEEREGGRTKLYLSMNHQGSVDLNQASHGYEHSDFHWMTLDDLDEFEMVPQLRELAEMLLEGI